MFFKIGAFKYFAIFTGKHMCWSLQHTCFHGMHLPPPVWGGGERGRVKIFRIVFAGGVQNFYFVGGVGGGSHNFEVKIKIA